MVVGGLGGYCGNGILGGVGGVVLGWVGLGWVE